ncbi:AAA family ATPase [Chitinophaga rhizophila]|uniref:ATP-binding protein n=1 Tax=Chitinophaga rhizophila TaxID=2866212 RepID=A0ABS7G960_9BACT|nr:ATP-binding protein [Chitinophaga rhizophila]MBW8683324.1 ATP-binding protein [Chitinophaga rhizophila]
MIVDFSLSNYRSFNGMQTLSFKATGLTSVDESVDRMNLIDGHGADYLKIVAIYGANGSGKSNIIEGLQFFSAMIVSSIEVDDLPKMTIQPFLFSSEETENFGYFQIILILGNSKYRYGFTIGKRGEIQTEWLFGPASHNETYYFKRSTLGIEVNPEWFPEGIELPKDKLREDSLFLTFCAAYDGKISRAIRDYFKSQVSFEGYSRYPEYIFDRSNTRYDESSTDELVIDGKKDLVLTWLREAGMNYSDIAVEKTDDERRRPRINLYKHVYDNEGKVVGQRKLNLVRDESQGSRKYYRYIGRLISKFENGGLFVSDEIDNNFHPSLLKKLISLFQNKEINKANAQLLFTSHDTNLMSPDYMRRDQFYFAEKTLLEDTRLYSLSDLKGIRNNADFARQYLSGAYGALPILGNYLEETEK